MLIRLSLCVIDKYCYCGNKLIAKWREFFLCASDWQQRAKLFACFHNYVKVRMHRTVTTLYFIRFSHVSSCYGEFRKKQRVTNSSDFHSTDISTRKTRSRNIFLRICSISRFIRDNGDLWVDRVKVTWKIKSLHVHETVAERWHVVSIVKQRWRKRWHRGFRCDEHSIASFNCG